MFGAHIYSTDVNRKKRPTFGATARVPPGGRKGNLGIGSRGGEGGLRPKGLRGKKEKDYNLRDWEKRRKD